MAELRIEGSELVLQLSPLEKVEGVHGDLERHGRSDAFLEDAHNRNVLRTVGPVYQFRHSRLEDRLAGQVTIPVEGPGAENTMDPVPGDQQAGNDAPPQAG